MKDYLTEERLGLILEESIDGIWIHNKTVPDSGIQTKPDFRNDKNKIIVEFDGYSHYTNPDVIHRDNLKNKVYTSMGYNVLRIPYFFQLKSIHELKVIFEINRIEQKLKPSKYFIDYSHGFIDKNCLLPSSYCLYGLSSFCDFISLLESDIDNYFIAEEIWKSLDNITNRVCHPLYDDQREPLPIKNNYHALVQYRLFSKKLVEVREAKEIYSFT